MISELDLKPKTSKLKPGTTWIPKAPVTPELTPRNCDLTQNTLGVTTVISELELKPKTSGLKPGTINIVTSAALITNQWNSDQSIPLIFDFVCIARIFYSYVQVISRLEKKTMCINFMKHISEKLSNLK